MALSSGPEVGFRRNATAPLRIIRALCSGSATTVRTTKGTGRLVAVRCAIRTCHSGHAQVEDQTARRCGFFGQRGVGNVPLVLIELSGSELPARRDESLVELVDYGRLADSNL
jgi:hypothetical protein